MFLLQKSYSIALYDHKGSADKDLAEVCRGLYYGTITSVACKKIIKKGY